jgi:membrane-associated phospholipid phosphatase
VKFHVLLAALLVKFDAPLMAALPPCSMALFVKFHGLLTLRFCGLLTLWRPLIVTETLANDFQVHAPSMTISAR